MSELGLTDSVRFVGYLDRAEALLDCYRAADVFVFASRTETQGLVLLEAMTLGLPVVSTSVMGTRDILDPGKGALVARGRPAGFCGGGSESAERRCRCASACPAKRSSMRGPGARRKRRAGSKRSIARSSRASHPWPCSGRRPCVERFRGESMTTTGQIDLPVGHPSGHARVPGRPPARFSESARCRLCFPDRRHSRLVGDEAARRLLVDGAEHGGAEDPQARTAAGAASSSYPATTTKPRASTSTRRSATSAW